MGEKHMKTKHTLALIICIAMLASLLLSLNASAKSGDFEFIVEETSNLFPTAITGYEDLDKISNSDDEAIITVGYRLLAPGYSIVDLAFELTYDEEILEYYPDFKSDAAGASETIIPALSPYGTTNFDDFADSGISGRGMMTVEFSGYAEAFNESGMPIVLVKVPFQIADTEAGRTNVDLNIITLALRKIPDVPTGSVSVDMAISDDEDIFIVENGFVNEEYLDLLGLSTVVSPSGVDLIALEAVNRVTDIINALPSPENVSSKDGDAIKAARAEYDALTSKQKSMLDASVYKKLTDCEAALEKAIDDETTLTISFSSDFCPDLPTIKAKVGEQITVKIPAPRDLDITYMFWLLRHDEKVLGSRSINTFGKGGYGDAHVGDNYTYDGGYAYQYIETDGTPLHLNKGDVMVEMTFKVLAPGQTTITFEATTEKGNTHKLTIDMGGFEDDFVYYVEDGANAYKAIFDDNNCPIGILKKKNGVYYEQVSILTRPLSEVESIDEYMFTPLSKILDFEVHEDTTLYAVWTKYVNNVNIVIEPPIAGERTSDIKVQTAHGNTYRIRTNQPKVSFKDSEGCVYFNGVWYAGYTFDENGSLHLTLDSAPYEAGKYYYARIYIDADIGYMLTAVEKNIKIVGVDEYDILKIGSTFNHVPECYGEMYVDIMVPCVTKDEAAVLKTKNNAELLPDVDKLTLDDKDDVKAAKAALDALTDEQKKLVPKDVVDKIEAANVAVDVLSLPDTDKLTKDDKAAVKAAKTEYDSLTDDQKKLVPKEIADKIIADDVVVDILSLPDVDKISKGDKAAIEAARKAYDALTDDQKKLVANDVLDRLITAENALKKASDGGTVVVVIIIVVVVLSVGGAVAVIIKKRKR